MAKNRMIAPIDEKNVTSDWICEVFDDCECTQTQKKSMCKYCGFIDGEVVMCSYHIGNNEIVWYCLSENPGDEQTTLIKRLQSWESEESTIFSEIEKKGNTISQRFYFKDED